MDPPSKKKLNGLVQKKMEEKNILKYNIKKKKVSQRELKRGPCGINCREVVFEVAFNNFW